MKRCLVIMLISISTHAAADWVQTAQTQTNTFYFDPKTIKNVGGLIRVWKLIDNVSPNRIGSLSSRMLVEVDCNGDQERTIEYTYHTGHMGSGEVNYSNFTVSTWFHAPPNSVQQLELRVLCPQ
jgi:hypothetical protein